MSPIEDTIISKDSNQLENVKEYIYLGQKIQLKKINKDAEIEQRILLIWAALGKLRKILTNKNIS